MTDDVAGGENPLPGVDISSTSRYPIWVERLFTVGLLVIAFLLIPDALDQLGDLNRAIQLPLVYCGLPIAAIVAARLLQIILHKTWKYLKA